MIQYVTETGSLVSCPCMLQGIAGKVYECKENLGFIHLAKFKRSICNIQRNIQNDALDCCGLYMVCAHIFPSFSHFNLIST